MSAQNSIRTFTIYIIFFQSKRKNEEGKLTKNLDTQKKNLQKYDEGEKRREKLMKRKALGEMRCSRVLVFIPRARNSSRKLRGCMYVPGK
jgi:hypothetical protein